MEERKNILLADDESKIREVVTKYLNREGFSVEQAEDGAQALALFHKKNWDLVILDIMMPKTDGIKVCQEIRKTSQVPVVMLTALNDEIDRILGLEIGADDYVGKPFSPRELVARIKAILRRTTSLPSSEKIVIDYPGITINLLTRMVTAHGQEIYLTPKEFDLLALMARNAGRVFTRELLLEEIWSMDYFGDLRTVDTHIKRLREKFKSLDIPSYINTVWGVGYKFEAASEIQ